MTEPKLKPDDITPVPHKKGGATYRGTVPDDDPRYQGGRNFLAGKNLAPKREDGFPSARIDHLSAKNPKPRSGIPEQLEFPLTTPDEKTS